MEKSCVWLHGFVLGFENSAKIGQWWMRVVDHRHGDGTASFPSPHILREHPASVQQVPERNGVCRRSPRAFPPGARGDGGAVGLAVDHLDGRTGGLEIGADGV
ncbi:MAG: hypothetical protein RIC55_17180 [Pirellulaceae bacterium]